MHNRQIFLLLSCYHANKSQSYVNCIIHYHDWLIYRYYILCILQQTWSGNPSFFLLLYCCILITLSSHILTMSFIYFILNLTHSSFCFTILCFSILPTLYISLFHSYLISIILDQSAHECHFRYLNIRYGIHCRPFSSSR